MNTPKRNPYSMGRLNVTGHGVPVVSGYGRISIDYAGNTPTQTADAAKAYIRWCTAMSIVSDQRRGL